MIVRRREEEEEDNIPTDTLVGWCAF